MLFFTTVRQKARHAQGTSVPVEPGTRNVFSLSEPGASSCGDASPPADPQEPGWSTSTTDDTRAQNAPTPAFPDPRDPPIGGGSHCPRCGTPPRHDACHGAALAPPLAHAPRLRGPRTLTRRSAAGGACHVQCRAMVPEHRPSLSAPGGVGPSPQPLDPARVGRRGPPAGDGPDHLCAPCRAFFSIRPISSRTGVGMGSMRSLTRPPMHK